MDQPLLPLLQVGQDCLQTADLGLVHLLLGQPPELAEDQLRVGQHGLAAMEATLEQVKVDVDAIKTTLDQVNLVELRQEVNDMKKRLEELESRVVK